jgi:hypothetical protein
MNTDDKKVEKIEQLRIVMAILSRYTETTGAKVEIMEWIAELENTTPDTPLSNIDDIDCDRCNNKTKNSKKRLPIKTLCSACELSIVYDCDYCDGKQKLWNNKTEKYDKCPCIEKLQSLHQLIQSEVRKARIIPDKGSGLIMFDNGAVVATCSPKDLLEDGQDNVVIGLLKDCIKELEETTHKTIDGVEYPELPPYNGELYNDVELEGDK